MKKEDISILEKGLADFESRLGNKYKGMDKEESYIQFLSEFINNDISPDFFLNPELESTRGKIKELRIWTMTEESDESMEAEIRLDGSEPEKSLGILTLTNEFQNCLIDKISNDGIKNFLAVRTKVPNISSGLSAKYILDGIDEKDLKDETNRLVIVLGIYYEFSLNLEK
ncbi:hypothetical protein [uncultured Maribacter sp.]|uniref:hypothetical protein n=1 Tax=uncultured Maribacter sp. TaxID=431308 RepID=UPI00261E3A60|nr:hypothetical protein [uncultured Maribacter sp.]